MKEQEDYNVIVIDDDEDVRKLVAYTLEMELINVETFKSCQDAINNYTGVADVIILDLMMPECSGRDFLKMFKNFKKFKKSHIIVLTAQSNSDEQIGELFKMGIHDYIEKPFKRNQFLSKVKLHCNLVNMNRKLVRLNSKLRKKNIELKESIKKEEFLNKRILDRTYKLKKAYCKIEKLNEKLKYSSTHDKLTKLYNRSAILTFLENDIQRTKRINTTLSLIIFDLDDFKKVNDTLGHLAGDEVLKNIAEIVKKNIREIDLIGRYGGEEFLIILPDTNLQEGICLCERLIKKLNENIIKTPKGDIKQTISIGITEYKNSETIDQFIERADTALYQAKKSGKNKYIAI